MVQAIPEALQAMMHRRRFWSEFTLETENLDVGDAYPEWDGEFVEFPITRRYKLSMHVGRSLSDYRLDLVDQQEVVEHGRPRRYALGHDDLHGWHPHSLRWEELELLSRAIACNDPTLAHPGMPLLLLQRWAPICRDDDADRIAGMLREAWKTVAITSDEDVHQLVEFIDARDAGFQWNYDEAAKCWRIQQEGGTSMRELYSYRSVENAEEEIFPSGIWEGLLQEVRSFVGPNPLPGGYGGATPRFKLRDMRKYELDLPLRRGDQKILIGHEQLAIVVDVIFRALRIGVAFLTGQRGDWATGKFVAHTAFYKLRVYEEEADRAFCVLKDVIRWAGAPEDDLKLKCQRCGVVPFEIDPVPGDGDETKRDLLFIAARGHFDRLGEVEIDLGLDASAVDVEALEYRTENFLFEGQSSFAVPELDGGKLRFQYVKNSYVRSDLACLFIRISDLSIKVAEVLFDFLLTRRLTLLPPMIKPTIDSKEGAPSNGLRLVHSPTEFYEIFRKGSFVWWCDIQYGDDLIDDPDTLVGGGALLEIEGSQESQSQTLRSPSVKPDDNDED